MIPDGPLNQPLYEGGKPRKDVATTEAPDEEAPEVEGETNAQT